MTARGARPVRQVLLFITLVVASGCWVTVKPAEGLACELPTYPCRSHEACVEGTCRASAADGGVSGEDGGAPGPWQQALHGFASTAAAPGCSVEVEPSAAHRLIASASPSATTVRAVGTVTERLPAGASCRAEGKVLFPHGAPYSGRACLLDVRSEFGTILTLSVGPEQVHVHGSANVLTTFAIFNGMDTATFPAVAQLTAAGVENSVRLEWTQGEELSFWMEGSRIFQRGLDPFGPASRAYPTQLRLGLCGMDQAPAADTTVILTDWSLTCSDAPDAGP